MIKREAKSSLIVRHWLRANPYKTSAIEMKDTRGKSYFNFSEISEAQINYLQAIESSRGVLLRVQAVAEGMPDYVYLRNVPGMVAIKYPNFIAIINIIDLVIERNVSKKKSLPDLAAKKIATNIIKFKKNV